MGTFKRHTSDKSSSIVWYETPKTELKWPYYNYEQIFKKNVDLEPLQNRQPNVIISNYESKQIVSNRRKETNDWIPGINLRTFLNLHGQYPLPIDIIDKIRNRNIVTDY